MAGIAYRAEIDGLRAFAVVPVILFHMGYKWIKGGFLGVDVFFVISGFLITSIVQRELQTGEFSFVGFWSRRARRILPALLFVVSITLMFAYPVIWKPDLPDVGKQAIAALLSLANIYFWREQGDYWGAEADQSPFLQTWSLSVEEQFYVVTPIAMWILFRRKRDWAGFMFGGIILSSFALFLYASKNHPVANFYLLPCRGWELASGCLLANVLAGHQPNAMRSKRRAALAFVSLACLLATYLFVERLGFAVLWTILATVSVLAFARDGVCNQLLSSRIATHLGRISYSLYLWHWPVLVYAEHLHLAINKLLLFVPIYLLSLATYLLIEKPTRRRQNILSRLALCYLLTCGLATAMTFTSPFYDTSRFAQSRWVPYNCHPDPDIYRFIATRMGSTEIDNSRFSPTAYRDGGIIVGASTKPPSIILLGDSHGCMWSDVFASIARRLDLSASLYCMDGVSPFIHFPIQENQQAYRLTSKQKFEYDKARVRSIVNSRPQVVVIAAAWNRYTEAETIETLTFLEQEGLRVLLLEQPPELKMGARNLAQHLAFLDVKPRKNQDICLPCEPLDQDEGGRGVIRALAKRFTNTEIVPTYDLFKCDEECLALVGRHVVYLDNNHLLAFGAKLAETRIQDAIAGALGEASSCRNSTEGE